MLRQYTEKNGLLLRQFKPSLSLPKLALVETVDALLFDTLAEGPDPYELAFQCRTQFPRKLIGLLSPFQEYPRPSQPARLQVVLAAPKKSIEPLPIFLQRVLAKKKQSSS